MRHYFLVFFFALLVINAFLFAPTGWERASRSLLLSFAQSASIDDAIGESVGATYKL